MFFLRFRHLFFESFNNFLVILFFLWFKRNSSYFGLAPSISFIFSLLACIYTLLIYICILLAYIYTFWLIYAFCWVFIFTFLVYIFTLLIYIFILLSYICILLSLIFTLLIYIFTFLIYICILLIYIFTLLIYIYTLLHKPPLPYISGTLLSLSDAVSCWIVELLNPPLSTAFLFLNFQKKRLFVSEQSFFDIELFLPEV